MVKGVPVVGGHFVGEGVSVIMLVVDDQALLLGMLESPDLPQQLRGFARKHRTVDELDGTRLLHSNGKLFITIWRANWV